MEYLEALKSIRDTGPRYPELGLCSNLHYAMQAEERPAHFYADMGDWPDGTGCSCYPVPSTLTPHSYGVSGKYMAEKAYHIHHASQSMYTGEYGALRYRLLDYLIQREEARRGEES